VPGSARSLALLAAGFLALAAQAQVLYKWIDAQGRVQYSDQPPKNFKGEVTRLEPDAAPIPAPAQAPPAKAPAPLPKAEPAPIPASVDPAVKRKELRAKLEGDIARARENLAKARKAREEEASPGVDERQVVQQNFAPGTQPATPRSNCREVVAANGKKGLMCPALVPSQAYYERMQQLDEAVARAEADLEAAERAYRRGVD
jgi:hypothetical protein